MGHSTKKIFAAVFLVVFLFSGNAFADNLGTKLGRGVTNILTSPLEYYNQYILLSEKQNDVFLPIVAALVYGTAGMLERIVVGVYDVVTFPIPVPADYKPLITPPTPFDAFCEMNK